MVLLINPSKCLSIKPDFRRLDFFNFLIFQTFCLSPIVPINPVFGIFSKKNLEKDYGFDILFLTTITTLVQLL